MAQYTEEELEAYTEYKDNFAHMVKCVSKWAETRYKGESMQPGRIRVDLDHSSLIHRLLKNKKFYEQAPPVSYSYPWYSLLDEGKAGAEIWFPKAGMPITQGPDALLKMDEVVINQNPCWKVLEKISDTEYIVGYEDWLKCKITTESLEPDITNIHPWTVEVINDGNSTSSCTCA